MALTFDVEHPDQPNGDPLIVNATLDRLHEAAIQASFFIQGSWAAAYPEIARRIANEGHLIGLHSQWHTAYTYLTDDGIDADLSRGHKIVKNVTGRDPLPWFRLPFGRGADDAHVLALLAESGFRSVYWNVDPVDWDCTATAAEVCHAMAAGTREVEGPAVIVCHSWSQLTMAALPSFIKDAREECQFVTLDQLPAEAVSLLGPTSVWSRAGAQSPFVG
ncbi:polysaccharide deacetylase family protein [Nonomuraea angiospora]|uniref:Peptidoglycan/xylan/chitin deacetylase (PgdA/CDA1 family) n=1 Tax=Nonomuraea angiospora TaxID=46172 RepID=A0ABR9LNR0_9ACTN|nr:polysaccharide deacetylase family protein [Nonomuraea angiospora]MBE1582291.1 peptidoglycan/xylan/chitin deacetylase (PgdA/CDA1 family) [Nonomuraea angiospora]